MKSNQDKKRVLITGVAGFIGSNLAHTLIDRGYSVVGFDDLSQGTLDNLEGILDHQQFDFFQGDVRDLQQVKEAGKDSQIIVHLAAYKIPRYSDAYDTLMINSLGSENILRLASEQKAKLVAASTSDVYGKNSDIPFKETHDSVIGSPDIKRWSYAVSKMFEEQLLFAGHDRFGIDVVLLRFFGGYGPNQNLTWWGGPQSVFIDAALDNEEIPIHGDGQQTRTFTYVSDHVDGIIRCIENAKANNLVFNLGAQQEISIKALAELIWRITSSYFPKLS